MTKKITRGASTKKATKKSKQSQEPEELDKHDDMPEFGLGGLNRFVDRYVSSEVLAGAGVLVTLGVCWLLAQKDMVIFGCVALVSTSIWVAIYLGLKQRE